MAASPLDETLSGVDMLHHDMGKRNVHAPLPGVAASGTTGEEAIEGDGEDRSVDPVLAALAGQEPSQDAAIEDTS